MAPATSRARQRAERLAKLKEDLNFVVPSPGSDPSPAEPTPEPEEASPFSPVETPLPPPVEPMTIADDLEENLPRVQVQEGNLATLAHEINARLTLATRADEKANDHRLAAALHLAAAKKACAEAKIVFIRWAENSIAQNRRTILLLAQVGSASDPAAALAELREKNALNNQRLRERRAISHTRRAAPTVAPQPALEAPTPEAWPDDRDEASSQAEHASSGRVEMMLEEFRRLSHEEQQEFLRLAMMAGGDRHQEAA